MIDMDLRTIVKTDPSPCKISYKSRVMFIGSCFASAVGMKMKAGRMPVMINPSGTVYNPVSVSNTLEMITGRKEFTGNDLYNYNGTYLSFYHYTDFSGDNPGKVLEKIKGRTKEAYEFMQSAEFLFITFGTARVYRWKPTGVIVSNCHKIPSSYFDSVLLTVDEIVTLWRKQLDSLHSLFPALKIVFTISPVRHWKDGAHGNQVSKSVLFLAVEELLKHPASLHYFPAYEILMDDLRDYRFYDNDMLHLSETAIDYIWNLFSESYIESKNMEIWREVVKITKSYEHRLLTDSPSRINQFAEKVLEQISEITRKVPEIDLKQEEAYFMDLLSGNLRK